MPSILFFFFTHATATTQIYTLSLTTLFRSGEDHGLDAVAGADLGQDAADVRLHRGLRQDETCGDLTVGPARSEEHTSELQSHVNLVCRLLLEKKNAIDLGFENHSAGGHIDR